MLRMRVVTEPHSPYIRWEYAATPHNEQAASNDLNPQPRKATA